MRVKHILVFSLFVAGCLYSFSAHAFVLIGPPPDPTPTPLPDPCVTFPSSPACRATRDAVVIVPGIVGSYNTGALFADRQVGTWKAVPFNKIYQGLEMRLEAEGYVQDTDLFVAYYDWRQPNAESAQEFLAPIIAEAKQKTRKVDIVAHSMGGLLVQQYIASDEYEEGEIDQFVMLGTPSQGASAAYLPWEGGIFPTTWSLPVRQYMNLIHSSLRVKRSIQDIEPKSYRQIFPSLKELLPVGNYLKQGDTESSSGERNTFLENLIAVRDDLLSSDIEVTTIAGVDNNTLGTVELTGERSDADEELGRWRDGHPVQEVPAPNTVEGDKTVLKSSALFGPNQIEVGNIPHNALPEYAQEEVLEALGVDSDEDEIFTYEEPQWLTGFVVLSPVDITITDAFGAVISKDVNDFGDDAFVEISDDEEADDPKVIIIKELEAGTYTVKLTGTDTGPYTVIVTHTDGEDSTSTTLTGTTTLGKEESFTVTIGDDGEVATVSEIKSDNPEGFTLSERSESKGKGDEKDCCPGRDTEIKTAKKGKVLGATTKKVVKKLKLRKVSIEKMQPLNGIFFEVYGRMPTYSEWHYWAVRYLTDKGDWEKLRNTMKYYKGKGISHPL